MRPLMYALMFAAAITLLPAATSAAEPTPPPATVGVTSTPPKFPSPFQTAILGLAFTAVVTVGARVTQRTSNTMMYMVLASITLTGILVAASDRFYSDFDRELNQRLVALQQSAR